MKAKGKRKTVGRAVNPARVICGTEITASDSIHRRIHTAVPDAYRKLSPTDALVSLILDMVHFSSQVSKDAATSSLQETLWSFNGNVKKSLSCTLAEFSGLIRPIKGFRIRLSVKIPARHEEFSKGRN